jgi:hypothetical protein
MGPHEKTLALAERVRDIVGEHVPVMRGTPPTPRRTQSPATRTTAEVLA